jgi:hypothetical protein
LDRATIDLDGARATIDLDGAIITEMDDIWINTNLVHN